MRAAATIIGLATACGLSCADALERDTASTGAERNSTLHEQLTLVFPMDEAELEGDDHSKIVTHSAPIERDRLYS